MLSWRRVSSERAALGFFVVYLLVGWWLLVFHLGSDVWFLRDDWKFLSGRDGGSIRSVLRAHDVHPAAIPVLVFRAMFNVFGLRFTPYLILIVTLHLGVAALLRIVMRRAGVRPWMATLSAGLLVLFGAGEQNIHWAFQINFVGSLLFGLGQLVLADHDGPIGRRDAASIACGLGSVLCSGVGPFMMAAVALAVLVRRGPRATALIVGPPMLTYVTWVLAANPASYEFGRPSVGVMWDWVREGERGTLEAIAQSAPVAVVLGAILVIGTIVVVRGKPLDELRRTSAVPFALLATSPLFFVLTAQGRWVFGLELARSSRYLYVGAVCILPALALAGDAVAVRWRLLSVAVVAALLAGIPGNIDAFSELSLGPRYFELQREVVLGVPRLPEAEQVSPWVRPLPDPYNGDHLTIGWLLEVRDDGRLPRLAELDERTVAKVPIILGLAQVRRPFPDERCVTYADPIDLELRKGEVLGLRSVVNVAVVRAGRPASPWVGFKPGGGQTLSVQLPRLDVRFAPAQPDGFTICGFAERGG